MPKHIRLTQSPQAIPVVPTVLIYVITLFLMSVSLRLEYFLLHLYLCRAQYCTLNKPILAKINPLQQYFCTHIHGISDLMDRIYLSLQAPYHTI